MTDSVDVQIADAIVAQIVAANLVDAANIERSYADVSEPLETLSTLKVDVVPWDCQPEKHSRSKHRYDVETDIVIRNRFGPADNDMDGRIPNSVVDVLPKLRQDIFELFAASQPTNAGYLTAAPEAQFKEISILSAMVRPHWKKYRQFTAWLRITHKWAKAPG